MNELNNYVTTFVVVWIETVEDSGKPGADTVTTFVVVWIETHH